jgi:hypothetical protein
MNLETDIFGMGKDALAKAHLASQGQAFFVAARRLQADGTWQGPSNATLATVEEGALPSVGGLAGACATGVNAVLCDGAGAVLDEAVARGLRCLVRVPYASDESAKVRQQRLDQLGALIRREPRIDGVVPTPTGDAQGLDTLQFFAACRMACPKTHLVVDLECLGHKLGQLCLSFGADEIVGSIVNQRALRLGARASSNEITRDEAALLLRASGFVPCERLPEGKVQVL